MVEKGGFDRREKVIVRIELVGWAYDGDLGRIGFYGYGGSLFGRFFDWGNVSGMVVRC